jgi:hypothetical protein
MKKTLPFWKSTTLKFFLDANADSDPNHMKSDRFGLTVDHNENSVHNLKNEIQL